MRLLDKSLRAGELLADVPSSAESRTIYSRCVPVALHRNVERDGRLAREPALAHANH